MWCKLTDLLDACNEFLNNVPLPRNLMATSIILIPKKDRPQTLSDFRPISLCNMINKFFLSKHRTLFMLKVNKHPNKVPKDEGRN